MVLDLTGGIDPARELVFAQRPDDPEMRDSVSFWTVDDRGVVGLPRIGVEALASSWDNHNIQINVAFGDGKVYRLRGNGPSVSPLGPDGQPTVLGAAGLEFRCTQPFRTWTMTYNGQAVRTSSEKLAQGDTDGPMVDLAFHVEATMAVPPWVQGSLRVDAAERLANSIEGGLMGGPRYEQLYRAVGSVTADGGPRQEFTGTGLRIRRQGVRKLGGFWGHCWQSAVFPSGRAFGYIAYPPRPDGQPTFNEGFLFEGDGELIPARVVQAPWLSRLQALGEDVALVLETERGTVEIKGETVFSTHDVHHADPAHTRDLKEMPQFPVVHQAGVRYEWDGEQAYGMLERSIPLDQIQRS